MKILYIGYWGANDGLSQSTINPHLEILMNFKEISSITYISLERQDEIDFNIPKHKKLIHYPIQINLFKIGFFNKLHQFTIVARNIVKLASKGTFTYVVCRSSLAGIYGLKIFRKTRIPFIVESFEPHANYMLEAGIWKKYGLSYLLQVKWEREQIELSSCLITVSNNYRAYLLANTPITEDRIFTNPCAVDEDKFRFDPKQREKIRELFQIPKEAVVGIYAGKFGGIYFSLEEALKLFRKCMEYFENFWLIILTPDKGLVSDYLYDNMSKRLICHKVSHDDVPSYLSASDFAFSLHSPTPSKKFVSPIKNGEYWANGLPVIMAEGIGDDSTLIKSNPLMGFICDQDFNFSLDKLSVAIDQERNSLVNYSGRSFSIVSDTYKKVLL